MHDRLYVFLRDLIYVVPILDLVYSKDYNICYFRKIKHVKIP